MAWQLVIFMAGVCKQFVQPFCSFPSELSSRGGVILQKEIQSRFGDWRCSDLC